MSSTTPATARYQAKPDHGSPVAGHPPVLDTIPTFLQLASSLFVIVVSPISFDSALAQSQSTRATATNSQQAADPLAPVHISVSVTASPLGPEIDRRNGEVFRRTLFSRDDQLFHLLDGGINVGQHEGGGKSIEIRRFGFNLDHGGGGGGLRVMVDNVPQNQSTQGHGQGYLGSLKSLTPELVEEVEMINGPFSAEYGDYSGLGVVNVQLKESLPNVLTARLQLGSYNSKRGFVSFSPRLTNRAAFVAYEGTHADGPFEKPLDYKRHNITGNYTWLLGDDRRFGFKWNGGSNRFNSSGQLPIDEVAAGRLDRFGVLSPGDGGEVMNSRGGTYYSRELANHSVLKIDGFVERSLFDLYSNFTFFLRDPVNGDAIQQHDSRLSEGANIQYARPQFFDGGSGTLTIGGNYLDTQTSVDLRQSRHRNPVALSTAAHARITNAGGYIQENVTLHGGKLQLGGGLRWDFFRFNTEDFLELQLSGTESAATLQPKAQVAFRPSFHVPFKVFFNYGRGVSSLDARGVTRRPEGPHLATTDFIQLGALHEIHDRYSLQTNLFIIQPSRQLVYVPDDGTVEFSGASRAYGFEVKTSVEITRRISLNAGVTKVLNGYYRDTQPRVFLDSAPRFTANAALTMANLRGWSGSLRMRAINHYRLNGLDPSILAVGHTVFDVAFSRPIRQGLELNFGVDNLLDRDYWETQNYFTSRLSGQQPVDRIHATPAFGRTVVVGLTFRFGEK